MTREELIAKVKAMKKDAAEKSSHYFSLMNDNLGYDSDMANHYELNAMIYGAYTTAYDDVLMLIEDKEEVHQ